MAATSDESPSDTKKKTKAPAFSSFLLKNVGDGDSKKEEKKKNEDKKMTKRQMRKQVNNKHLWPQQPRIQSPEVRAKAYLRVAGLTQKPNQELSVELDLHSPSVKFCRKLGDPDQRIRHQAVLQLQTYFKSRCDSDADNTAGVSELDLLKLWKALWHTLYMADKVNVQEELSEKLASLIWCFAGTEEEDEYAGQAYMNLCDEMNADEEENDEDDHSEDDEGDRSEEEDEEGDDEEEDEEDMIDQRYTMINGKRVKVEDLDGDGDEEDVSDVEVDADVDVGEEGEQDEEEDEEGVTMEEVDGLPDSEIPHCRGAHLASLFVRTFLCTVRREWGRMDKYRVDKFYVLVRKMMHQVFKYMSLRHWNLGIIRLFNDAIFEEALCQTPNGLRYHLIDLSLEELTEVHKEAPLPLTEATFIDCLEPYFAMAQTGGGGDDMVQKRVVEKVLERFLNKYSVVSPIAEGEDVDTKSCLFNQVHVGTIAKFIFDLASDPDTRDDYRKSLYEVHKQYARRLKLVGKDVVLTQEAMEEEEIEYEEETPPKRQKGALGDNDYDDENSEEEQAEYNGDVEDTPERRRGKQPSAVAREKEAAADSNDDKKKKQRKNKKKHNSSEHETESQGNKKVEIKMGKTEATVETQEPAKKQKSKKESNEDMEKTEATVETKEAAKKEKSKKESKAEKKARLSQSSDRSSELSSPGTEESVKKQDSKKNKSRERIEESAESTELVTDSDRSGDEKAKKKRKKKKRKANNDQSESSEGGGTSPDVEERKRQKTSKDDAAVGSDAIEELFDKKKKLKKAKNKSDNEEEEVVISKSEQEKAKTAAKKESSSHKEEENTPTKKGTLSSTGGNSKQQQGGASNNKGSEAGNTPNSKRVKFGSVNHARSYTASMKALRTANPRTPPAAPEQSILRAKSLSPKPKQHHKNNNNGGSGGGGGRKKAIDYF